MNYNERKEYRAFLNEEPFMKEKDLVKEAQYTRQFLQRCPVCNVYEHYITNVHCVNQHGMTKKEVEAKYGVISSASSKHRWSAKGRGKE